MGPSRGESRALRRGDDRLRTADFDYPLPTELIADRPAPRRDESRMLVVERDGSSLRDSSFADFADFPSPGDAVVLNDTRVFPARLLGRKPTGARVELLLLRPLEPEDPSRWEALVRPGSKLKPGRRVRVADDFEIEIRDSTPDGGRLVDLLGDDEPWSLIERHGQVPLPPYIRRPVDDRDRERYQTVYAERTGSVAAPTAGLHFTPEILARLERRGVRLVRITLHVGLGTFRPVESEDPAEHEMGAERYRLPGAAAEALNRVRDSGGLIWAVGSTACRTLETCAAPDGRFTANAGWTDLFIRQPHEFRGVDRLLTNFHLPRSTLLMLVAAFAGHGLAMCAYEHAIAESYRFYSYGDAMLIL